MAQIVLTQVESELYFYNALCNAVGIGYMEQMSLELCFDQNQYETAKQNLVEQGKTGICYEDVLMQILKLIKLLILERIQLLILILIQILINVLVLVLVLILIIIRISILIPIPIQIPVRILVSIPVIPPTLVVEAV